MQVWSKPGDEQVEEISTALCYGVLDELLDRALGVTCDGCDNVVDLDTCGCGTAREFHASPMDAGHAFLPMGCDCMRAK
jgi:hypothetical protein